MLMKRKQRISGWIVTFAAVLLATTGIIAGNGITGVVGAIVISN